MKHIMAALALSIIPLMAAHADALDDKLISDTRQVCQANGLKESVCDAVGLESLDFLREVLASESDPGYRLATIYANKSARTCVSMGVDVDTCVDIIPRIYILTSEYTKKVLDDMGNKKNNNNNI